MHNIKFPILPMVKCPVRWYLLVYITMHNISTLHLQNSFYFAELKPCPSLTKPPPQPPLSSALCSHHSAVCLCEVG